MKNTLLLFALAFALVGCNAIRRPAPPVPAITGEENSMPAAPHEEPFHVETGIASHYKPQHTASGLYYRSGDMIAAHKTLPMGTRVYVTCLKTHQSCWVRIIDRGPYIKGRIIDLSDAAAKELGIHGKRGIGKVHIEAYRSPKMPYVHSKKPVKKKKAH